MHLYVCIVYHVYVHVGDEQMAHVCGRSLFCRADIHMRRVKVRGHDTNICLTVWSYLWRQSMNFFCFRVCKWVELTWQRRTVCRRRGEIYCKIKTRLPLYFWFLLQILPRLHLVTLLCDVNSANLWTLCPVWLCTYSLTLKNEIFFEYFTTYIRASHPIGLVGMYVRPPDIHGGMRAWSRGSTPFENIC